jgi:hypothetical protein
MRFWQRGRRGRLYGGLIVVLLVVVAQAQTPSAGRLAIDHKGFTQPQPQGQPLLIEATITSPAGIHQAEVFCRQAGGRDFTALKMVHVGQDVYRTVVPDWMAAGTGLEYYITASDQQGRSTSQGFVGFPLIVRLVPPRQQTPEERVKTLNETLDLLRKRRDAPTMVPGGGIDPQQQR